MPKVREAIKLIEADGWRTMTTKGSHRQFKYQSKDGAAVDTPGTRRQSGPFWLMVEAMSTIVRRNP